MKNSSDKGYAKIPLSEIDILTYNSKTRSKLSEIMVPGLMISAFTMLVSPLFCINFDDGTFNSERFKYFGIGSSIGLSASIFLGVTMSSSKKIHFKTSWPSDSKKVWSFEND